MSIFKQVAIDCTPRSNNCKVLIKKLLTFLGGMLARNALKWWNLNNKPRDGYIYHEMKTYRARFKYALCFIRSIEGTFRADCLTKYANF